LDILSERCRQVFPRVAKPAAVAERRQLVVADFRRGKCHAPQALNVLALDETLRHVLDFADSVQYGVWGYVSHLVRRCGIHTRPASLLRTEQERRTDAFVQPHPHAAEVPRNIGRRFSWVDGGNGNAGVAYPRGQCAGKLQVAQLAVRVRDKRLVRPLGEGRVVEVQVRQQVRQAGHEDNAGMRVVARAGDQRGREKQREEGVRDMVH
jgi:hypothetical protein